MLMTLYVITLNVSRTKAEETISAVWKQAGSLQRESDVSRPARQRVPSPR